MMKHMANYRPVAVPQIICTSWRVPRTSILSFVGVICGRENSAQTLSLQVFSETTGRQP
jgi:hypothetical protein